MAATYTRTSLTVFGNSRVSMGTVDMTGVTAGTFSVGLDTVDGFALTAKSANSGGIIGRHSTDGPGQMYIASCTAGDVFYVVAFGK